MYYGEEKKARTITFSALPNSLIVTYRYSAFTYIGQVTENKGIVSFVLSLSTWTPSFHSTAIQENLYWEFLLKSV